MPWSPANDSSAPFGSSHQIIHQQRVPSNARQGNVLGLHAPVVGHHTQTCSTSAEKTNGFDWLSNPEYSDPTKVQLPVSDGGFVSNVSGGQNIVSHVDLLCKSLPHSSKHSSVTVAGSQTGLSSTAMNLPKEKNVRYPRSPFISTTDFCAASGQRDYGEAATMHGGKFVYNKAW